MMQLKIQVFPVYGGDCMTLSFDGVDQQHHIIIDAGYVATYYQSLGPFMESLGKEETVDLFVITHTDADHIGGMSVFVKEYGTKDKVEEYWFNSSPYEINLEESTSKGIKQGIGLRDYLVEIGKIDETQEIVTDRIKEKEIGPAKLTLLSPDRIRLDNFDRYWKKYVEKQEEKSRSIQSKSSKANDHSEKLSNFIATFERQEYSKDDTAVPNGSSIAFLLELYDFKGLFLGDAHPHVIEQSLRGLGYSEKNPLKLDMMKLSHHGAKANTSSTLLSLIDCRNYIVSANGTSNHHPNKETLAKVLYFQTKSKESINFLFNHNNDTLKGIFSEEEKNDDTYNFKCIFPDEEKSPMHIPNGDKLDFELNFPEAAVPPLIIKYPLK